jgi:N-acetylglutamate synthase-like GNAT family acetyltransferase
VWLLTETAEAWFASVGFVAVPRAEVPAELMSRPAVADACGDTAVAMRLDAGS